MGFYRPKPKTVEPASAHDTSGAMGIGADAHGDGPHGGGHHAPETR
jgi:hypothetical protein